MNRIPFVEVGSESRSKFGQRVTGDTFLSQRIKEENRTVAVLSDGLGSGIKASVLSTLTASMALKFITNQMDIEKVASVIMKTLPVCRERRISYATFTILDIYPDLTVNIVEYDNPPFILLRDGLIIPVNKKKITVEYERKATLLISKFQAHKNDRIIFFSDGLTQSGMGKHSTPFGWGIDGVSSAVLHQTEQNPSISARNLAKTLVNKALENDGWQCGDDTTCGVIYFRKPRKTLVVTGAPADQANDKQLASVFSSFDGKKVICGGTTAKILGRELGKSISVDLRNLHPEVPPHSNMDGVDLVTEGIITMTKSMEYLDRGIIPESNNAAALLAEVLLESDEITFMVGTSLNQANQIHLSQNMELRQSIVRRLAATLEQKYLKSVLIRYN
jgi:hypothetical protein